jgi:hypothetical protein
VSEGPGASPIWSSILHLYDDSEVIVELFRGHRSFGFVLLVVRPQGDPLSRRIIASIVWQRNLSWGKKAKMISGCMTRAELSSGVLLSPHKLVPIGYMVPAYATDSER